MHLPPCCTSYPSMRTSWLLMTASSPFLSQNLSVMSGPNWRPTPRLLGPLPGSSCGSVHSISIISPDWPGCRWLCLSSFRMSSRVMVSSENRPPWRTRYLDPTRVAKGRAEKLSEKSLNTLRELLETRRIGNRKKGGASYLSLYFALHSPSKP